MAYWKAVPWMLGIGMVAIVGYGIGWVNLMLCCCGVTGAALSVVRLLAE